MQSFKVYVVSDHLKDIYPYLEAPFKERYDPTEVYHAVFDRQIPKLVEILLMENLEHYKYRDAFITLNEMCSHQENKDDMISQGLVEISSAYLKHKVIEIRREACLLLGSLCTIKQGRDHLTNTSQEAIKHILFEENLLMRMACAWCLCRIATGQDGIDILVDSQVVRYMVDSFIDRTREQNVEEAQFIIIMLEAFVMILKYDDGIQFFLKTKIVPRLNDILKNPSSVFGDDQYWPQRVNYLILDCLGKVSMNHEGKQEGIENQIIRTASTYLESAIEKEVYYAVILIMNCSIHLDGKKQCVEIDNHAIITKLIKILVSLNNQRQSTLRRNIIVIFQSLAEYRPAYLILTEEIALYGDDRNEMIQLLDEIFGWEIIVPLSDLLPATRDLKEPPKLPPVKSQPYKIFCQAIVAFLLSNPKAGEIARQNIVCLVEKIAPFVLFRDDKKFQDLVFKCLFEMCENNPQILATLATYFEVYGEVHSEDQNTSLNEELRNHSSGKLFKIIQEQIEGNSVSE